MKYLNHLLTAAGLIGLAAAQVSTDCNPMQKDCPADPAWGTDHTFNFNQTPSFDLWETTAGSVSFDSKTGAAFTIAKQGDSPTLRTKFYFFFGRTEIWLKTAPGRGIVSSTMWLSDDLDEVDWEFLGSNNTVASTNYFGKGFQDYHNGGIHPMPKGPQDDYHNYTTVWTKDQIDWFIDDNHVRTLTAAAANGTKNYPQTPMRLSLGIWAGGDPSLPEGTRQWAGGDTDYAHGPYTMYVKSVQVTDYSSGQEYTYGDRSGSYQSIKITSGNSTAFEALQPAVPQKTVAQKWAELPAGARIGIYCASAGIGAAIIGALLFYCIKQRRAGAKEAKFASDRAIADRMEMEKLKREGVDADSFTDFATEYKGAEKEPIVAPLDSKGFSRVDIESPLGSPVANAHEAEPATAPYRDNVRSSSGPAAFKLRESAIDPGRTSSPGLPSSPQNRISSPAPSRLSLTQRVQSHGSLASVRNFSANVAGYRGLPGGEV